MINNAVSPGDKPGKRIAKISTAANAIIKMPMSTDAATCNLFIAEMFPDKI